MGQAGASNPNWKGGISLDHMHYKRLQRERHPSHVYARELVRRAVKSGRLIRQPCTYCQATAVQAHHEDYSKPLDVIWVCRSCHDKRHPVVPVRRPGDFVWRGRVRNGHKTGNR